MSQSGRHPASRGRRIAALRIRRGLTQEELARRANVSRATVQNLEAGRADGPRILPRVAAALGTNVDTLNGDDTEPPTLADIPTDVLAAEVARRLNEPTPAAERLRYEVDMGDGTTVTVIAGRPLSPDEQLRAAGGATRTGVSTPQD